LSACWRFMRPTLVALTTERFKIACSRQCGATSTTTAPSGTCPSASWKRTGDRRLFTWYAADEFCASAVFQADSGIDELIQRDVRCLGFGMIYKTHDDQTNSVLLYTYWCLMYTHNFEITHLAISWEGTVMKVSTYCAGSLKMKSQL
jgi:hypothetical protein